MSMETHLSIRRLLLADSLRLFLARSLEGSLRLFLDWRLEGSLRLFLARSLEDSLRLLLDWLLEVVGDNALGLG